MFSSYQLIYLIILCIKVLRYIYKKLIVYEIFYIFMSKSVRLKGKIFRKLLIFRKFNTFLQNNERNHIVAPFDARSQLMQPIDNIDYKEFPMTPDYSTRGGRNSV